nr:DUF262 domain-containing protein [uncultured Campylobacter sp.]
MNVSIKNLSKILDKKLKNPNYQRPYTWSTKSALVLFNDIFREYKNNKNEYRIGSTILHQESENYNIVDGQQRLTTLTILLNLLGQKEKLPLLEQIFNPLSFNSIINNNKILKQKAELLTGDEKEKFKQFILNNCTMVEIVVTDQQEAFNYFDSQNTRGKALEVHDLLKAYHLRHMLDDDEAKKVQVISNWEDKNSDEIKEIFSYFLFPIIRWQRRESGLYYSKDHIDIFKGIDHTSLYNVTKFNKAVIEFGAQNSSKFLLTQDLLSGKHFFDFTAHYLNLYHKIKKFVEAKYDDNTMPRKKRGDKYIVRLFECLIMAFVDRFGFDELNENICAFFYRYVYTLRLVKQAVYLESINKYALGYQDENNGLNLFEKISHMRSPDEIYNIELENITIDKEEYKSIVKELGIK